MWRACTDKKKRSHTGSTHINTHTHTHTHAYTCMKSCNHNICHLVAALIRWVMQFFADPVGVKHPTLLVQYSYTHTHTHPHTHTHASPYQTAHCGNCHDLMHFLSYIWLHISQRKPFSSRLRRDVRWKNPPRLEYFAKEWVADLWSPLVRYSVQQPPPPHPNPIKHSRNGAKSLSDPSSFSHSQRDRAEEAIALQWRRWIFSHCSRPSALIQHSCGWPVSTTTTAFNLSLNLPSEIATFFLL